MSIPRSTFIVFLSFFVAGIALGQELSEEELAKQAQNPVASLISLPIQNNTNVGIGPDGEPVDITDKRHPQKRTMELGPRDKLSQAFVKEHEKGNTIKSAGVDVGHLDIRHLSAKKIRRKLWVTLMTTRLSFCASPCIRWTL